MSNLSYEEYNDRAFVVYGDREKFTKTLRELGGRWNSRLKNGAGWTLPREKEEDLKKIIESLENDKDKQIDLIKQNVKSRKEQNKYCRAVSNSSSDEKQSPPKTEAAPQVEAVEKVKQSASASASSSEEEEKEPEVKISVEENLLKERKEKERKKFEQEKREHEAKQKSQVQQSNSERTNSERTNSQRTNSQNTKENRKELEQPREVSRQPPRETREAPRESKETVRDAPRERRHSRDARESRDKHRERRHSRDRKEGRKSRHSREQSRHVREQPREVREQPRQVREVREQSRERRHSRDRKDPRESRTEVRDTGRDTGRDNINYYKSFAKKKDTFKALYEKSESDTFTSSSEEDSSSDDFPTPESPKRRNHKNRSVEEDKLYNKVKDLQKQLYEMQIKQKKQKYEKK